MAMGLFDPFNEAQEVLIDLLLMAEGDAFVGVSPVYSVVSMQICIYLIFAYRACCLLSFVLSSS